MDALIFDHTLRTVATGAAILGVTAGALGCYALLRRQSLIGDVISHAALPGVALGFILTGTQATIPLLIGAGLSGWAATALAQLTSRHTRIKIDAALGIGLSVFFGLGIVLRTLIQHNSGANQAALDKFLLGNASTLLNEDIIIMGALGGTAIVLLIALWKEFKLATFDAEFAASQGLPVRLVEGLLTALIVVAIVIGLQTVGVVLMSALLVAPAAAARQWTDRLSAMVVLAAVLGAAAGIGGALLSASVSNLPTGPVIVLLIGAIVVVSLFFAPNRGLLWDWLRRIEQQRHLKRATVLAAMLHLAESHASPFHSHDASSIAALTGASVRRLLPQLLAAGLVRQTANEWALTEQGLHQAQHGEVLP
ncbi:MAG: metal ABC transporter permease [bacterium]|nr:metal ABC transporter permease [bacterium]